MKNLHSPTRKTVAFVFKMYKNDTNSNKVYPRKPRYIRGKEKNKRFATHLGKHV